MAEPAVTVVIPVLDEVATLGALLDDLMAQELRPAEILVVDAGSTDGTAESVRDRSRDAAPLELVVERGATPGRGRNAGIERAGTPLIATLDAGSRVGPGWLGALLGTDPGKAREVRVGVARPDAANAFEEASGWLTLRAFKTDSRPSPTGRVPLPAGRNGYLFHKADWRRAGGYPPDLPWGEDKLFLRRMMQLGLELVFVDEATVRWRPRPNLYEVYRQYRRYSQGDAMARIESRNSLLTFAIWLAGAALAAATVRGSTTAGVTLTAGMSAYLGLFALAARRDLSCAAAVAWVPAIRLAVDVAKMHGFAAGKCRIFVQRRSNT